MPTIQLNRVPEQLHAFSSPLERATTHPSCVREVPGLVGWAIHQSVRLPDVPLKTHVCATSYDHLNIDLDPVRVAQLYESYPQTETFVSIAGVTDDALSIVGAIKLLSQCDENAAIPTTWLPEIELCTDYVARPIFLLHGNNKANTPFAVIACRYEITHVGLNRLYVDVSFDSLAVDPAYQHQGLAHLAVLEASRWLGMLTRSLLLTDNTPLTLNQRVHANPKNAVGYHLSQTFFCNFCYFSINDELLDNVQKERNSELFEPGQVRAGLSSITRHAGVEDLIHIPDDAKAMVEEQGFAFL